MKRAILSWVGIILLVGALGTGYVYWQNSQEAQQQNQLSEGPDPAAQPVTPTEERIENAANQPGVYADYQEGLVASTDGVQLLFFHAPWCPQCRMIESDIEKQGVPNGVTVLKVDYDSNQALRQRYEVTLQTTFVEIDKDGNKIDSYVAYNEPTFDSVKANLLE